MRTRTSNRALRTITQGAVTGYPVHFVNCDGSAIDTTGTVGGWSQVTKGSHETIHDSTGRKSPHPCQHRRLTFEVNEDAPPYCSVAPNGVEFDTGLGNRWILSRVGCFPELLTWNTGVFPGTTLPARWSLSSLPISEDVMKNDVIEKSHQLKADVLLNVAESNQMWPAIKSLSTVLPNIGYNWEKWRRSIKQSAGAFLAWKFGISPLISDAVKIHEGLGGMRADYQKHVDGAKRKFSRNAFLQATFNNVQGVDLMNGLPWLLLDYQGLAPKPPSIRYVLIVKPRVQYKTDLFKSMDYALSRFATSPASFAWEKVPFSFVVDWLVDVRGVASKIDKTLGFEPYEVISFTRSFSYRLTTQTWLELRSACAGNQLLHRSGAVNAEYSHYERSMVPETTSLSWKPRFGKSQAAISVALISQMLFKKH